MVNNGRKWEIIHGYRRQVRRGLAEPTKCDVDNTEMVPVIDHDDEPALKCLYCGVVQHIGLSLYEAMEAKL